MDGNGPVRKLASVREGHEDEGSGGQSLTPTHACFEQLSQLSLREKRRRGVVSMEDLKQKSKADAEASELPMRSALSSDCIKLPMSQSPGPHSAPDGNTQPAGQAEDRRAAAVPTMETDHGRVEIRDSRTLHSYRQHPSKTNPFLPMPDQVVDLDRDRAGRRIPGYRLVQVEEQLTTGQEKIRLEKTPSKKYMRHGNTYTYCRAPELAELAAQQALKRRRQMQILPPNPYQYRRTNDPNFNIFQGFLLIPELIFLLAPHLTIQNLIDLYAISRDFHRIIDTRFTTVILGQASSKFSLAASHFPFRCFKYLCRQDPDARIPHPDPIKAAAGMIRSIPSFRWLRFLAHRSKVVHEILTVFAEDGVPLPERCRGALLRIWFILDLPDNPRRIGYLHQRHLVTNQDLYYAQVFFVKLDMRLNDPVGASCRMGLRRLLLAQRSLTTVLKVVKREIWRDRVEILQAWVRTYYSHGIEGEQELPVFGVPKRQQGLIRFEHWGQIAPKLFEAKFNRPPQLLLRPDQLVVREAVRRGVGFRRQYLKMLLHGYIDMDSMTNVPRAPHRRRIPKLEDEYGSDDELGRELEEEAVTAEDGGDELLDLGSAKPVSTLCVRTQKDKAKIGARKARRDGEEKELHMCMAWSLEERQAQDKARRQGYAYGDVDMIIAD